MSYLITETYAPVEVDLLTPYNISGSDWLLYTPTTYNTDISTSGASITLYSGSSYYIEAGIQARCGGGNGAITWQIYDATNAQYVGQEAHMNLATSYGAVGRVGRKVCTALILDSDIATSMELRVRRKSLTGTSWSYSITQDVGISNIDYAGYPSIRVWQLPS
jgi:hypothetical protein